MTKEDSNPVSLSKKKTEKCRKMWKFGYKLGKLRPNGKIDIIYANGNE